jgi:hypothetical protein
MKTNMILDWLSKRNITLEESFVQSLVGMAMTYQHTNGIHNINDVYKLIGVRKQLITYWRSNPSSTQTKKF